MIQNFKILRLLSSLKKKEFIYFFKKNDFWFRLVTVLFIIYFVVNSILSSSFIVQFVKNNFSLNSVNFIPVFNIVLFFIFLVNIVAIIFVGTSNYDQSSVKTLLRYPITVKQIIFSRTVSVSSEWVNIIFLPLYFSAYFITGNSFNLTGIIFFLFILLLFLFCINSIIEFLRNFTTAVLLLNKFKSLFWVLFFALFLLIILSIPKIPPYLSNENSVKRISEVLFYLPTGVFTKAVIALNGQNNTLQIVVYFLYLILFSVALFAINLFLAKFYKNCNYGKTRKEKKIKKPAIPSLLSKTTLGSFEKKNLIYLYRSPRALLNVLVFIIYEVLLTYFVTVHLNDVNTPNINVVISFTVLFQSAMVLTYAGNFFSFDYSGIINYFFRPLETKYLIKSKILILNILVIFNMMIFIYFTFLLKINKYDFLLQANFLVLTYFISIFVAVLLSLNFPKTVGFYALMGANAPIITVIISIIISFGFWGLNYVLLAKITNIAVILTIILCVFVVNLLAVYFKNDVVDIFNKVLIKQKEKIIDKIV